MASIKAEILRYVKTAYRAEPDYPFPNDRESFVLRHADTRKWFAIVMDVPRGRLGLEEDGSVEIINLKCSAELSGSLRLQEGILPAYHMNHESWISVLLDGTVPAEDVFPLIDISFRLTEAKKKKR